MVRVRGAARLGSQPYDYLKLKKVRTREGNIQGIEGNDCLGAKEKNCGKVLKFTNRANRGRESCIWYGGRVLSGRGWLGKKYIENLKVVSGGNCCIWIKRVNSLVDSKIVLGGGKGVMSLGGPKKDGRYVRGKRMGLQENKKSC